MNIRKMNKYMKFRTMTPRIWENELSCQRWSSLLKRVPEKSEPYTCEPRTERRLQKQAGEEGLLESRMSRTDKVLGPSVIEHWKKPAMGVVWIV